jgi:Ser/Thr protein kinase RdoA (MazF antagonist)
MGTAPQRLWDVGTYWHLDTRREELAGIDDARVRAAAPELDRALRQARHQTLVHGDAKPANFCFTRDGRRVAAVDFQYVGGGPGVRDVAYLLHGSSRADESRALDAYFSMLRAALANDADANAIEDEWRSLYPTARADFERFLQGWRR